MTSKQICFYVSLAIFVVTDIALTIIFGAPKNPARGIDLAILAGIYTLIFHED